MAVDEAAETVFCPDMDFTGPATVRTGPLAGAVLVAARWSFQSEVRPSGLAELPCQPHVHVTVCD